MIVDIGFAEVFVPIESVFFPLLRKIDPRIVGKIGDVRFDIVLQDMDQLLNPLFEPISLCFLYIGH